MVACGPSKLARECRSISETTSTSPKWRQKDHGRPANELLVRLSDCQIVTKCQGASTYEITLRLNTNSTITAQLPARNRSGTRPAIARRDATGFCASRGI